MLAPFAPSLGRSTSWSGKPNKKPAPALGRAGLALLRSFRRKLNGPVSSKSSQSSKHSRDGRRRGALNGILDVDELPFERKLVGQPRSERLNAERLGCVVAAGEEVDAELAGGLQGRLLGLARDEGVEALVRGLDQPRSAAAGDDRDTFDPLGPRGEDERLGPGRLA